MKEIAAIGADFRQLSNLNEAGNSCKNIDVIAQSNGTASHQDTLIGRFYMLSKTQGNIW